MQRLENKVALITGGARGIGEGIVRRFVEERARVLITDILDDEGEALARELGDSVQFLHGGAIVNMSSADGIAGANAVSVYCATKFAVRGLTKALALELGPRKIRVNSIHPGGIYTPLANPMNVPKDEYDKSFWNYPAQHAGEAKDIAAAAAYLASDDARYCMGAELSVDGGMNAGHYYAPSQTSASGRYFCLSQTTLS